MSLKEACQKLYILMWKHFTVRYRRYINTTIEIVVPLVVYKFVWDTGILALASYMSLLVVFEFLMSRLIDERASGIQEHIKMVGVTNKLLGLSHFLNVLPGGLIFSFIGTLIVRYWLDSYSNGFLIWLFLMLHYISIVALAFACSYILNNAQHSTFLANFIYIAAVFASIMLNLFDISEALVPLDGLLPLVPGHWFCFEMMELESRRVGVTFSSMAIQMSKFRGSALMAFVFLLLQIFIFFTIAWYLSFVRPGKYGTALPWNFFLRREFWTKDKKVAQSDSEVDTENQEERYLLTEEKYFEPLPSDSEVGIKIENVTKIFGDYHALNNLNLSVLKSEITVLLGHNGAGKTTLMSIITGMMSATRGKVYINGLDTVSHQSQVRSQLGFCPQHNLFFNELTVLQHVMFFSMLKGIRPYSKAYKSSRELLNHLGLDGKADSLSGQLSGGMKRRLQLACALAGDASVLVLDEPTSGLDVETRRSLWDLLLTLRTGRTVLLSTHFMEEADALGDRVAALHSGTLRCYATPMHLKKEIDTGYRLSIGLTSETSKTEAERNISRVITSILPKTTQLPESGVQTLAYKLPSKQSDKFPALFKELEDGMKEWGIESIGVGVSTLEEVFLKLCSDVSAVAPGDGVDSMLLDDSSTHRITGIHRVARQFAALFGRQFRYAMSSWKSFVVMQIILPILVFFAVFYTEKESHYDPNKNAPMTDLSIKFWATFTAFLFQTTLSNAVVLPSKERASSTRHIHIMFGCNPELYWLTTLVYHLTYSVVVLIVPITIFAVTLDEGHVLSRCDTMSVLILTLFLGTLAFLSMTFFLSFIFSSYKVAASTLVALIFVFSLIIGSISPTIQIECFRKSTMAEHNTTMMSIYDQSVCAYVPLFKASAYMVTPHTIVEAMIRVLTVGQLNAFCTLNKADCPDIKGEFGFDVHKCCVLNELPRCYFCFDVFSPAPHLVALLIQLVVFMVLVFLAERGIFSEFYERILNSKYIPEPYHRDEILEEEQKYVKEALSQPQDDALLVSAVHKRYPTLICGKSMTAVKDISFAIHEGECFGLVGVNGAGKSTTFKMMTCETLPTLGQIVANGQPQRLFDNAEFLKGMGYCAQFSALDDFLTGRQNMELLLTLDGVSAEAAKKEAVAWLELIDLKKYADKPLSTYSGGCSRRLCSVAALARRAALSLLDEPTAGVDVAARRQLWRAVRAAQAQTTLRGRKRAVLITSHSMDEMEALCARVAIMSAGRLATLGSPAALRAAHKAGFALFIKIKDAGVARPNANTEETDNAVTVNPDLHLLKQACLNFQWTLKDAYKTMLNYHVGKELRMKYSELFGHLEELRERFPALVEDYAVTETTLEQVFLSYAKTESAVV